MSAFDPRQQNVKEEFRIVASMERIAEAFRVLLWQKSRETGLSPIQMQLLIFILFHSEDKATITHLAKEFNMTKATVSDSVKLLEDKKLICRNYSEKDSRSFSIVLTTNGTAIAKSCSSFSNPIVNQVQGLDKKVRTNLMTYLLEIIDHLDKEGIIATHRMCTTCRFFAQNYCTLMKRSIAPSDKRLDCPEHEKK